MPLNPKKYNRRSDHALFGLCHLDSEIYCSKGVSRPTLKAEPISLRIDKTLQLLNSPYDDLLQRSR